MSSLNEYLNNQQRTYNNINERVNQIREGLSEVRDDNTSQTDRIETLYGAVDELAMLIAGEM